MSKAVVQAESQVFLDQLDLNVTGPIVAMVCRKWDVNDAIGRYLSTDFLISDSKGNIMHCTAMSKRTRSFVNRLKEGNIYTINHFAVIPNTEEYPIIGNSAYIIHFHGHTTARRSSVKSDGFVRHPFDLLPFDDLQAMDETYLIDVFEFITDVGVNILNDFESVKPKRKRLIKASELCIPSIISEDETEKSNAIVDLETGIGPFGSELPENDKSDAEVKSAIGPIGNEALEYDNCDSEVVTKKKTKRDDVSDYEPE